MSRPPPAPAPLPGAAPGAADEFRWPAELRRRGLRTELLAGGEFRRNISQGLGFSRADRVANIRRIGYVAKLLSRNGVAVVATSISPFREEVRRMTGRFFEVSVDAPLEVCEARDTDGLYQRARLGLADDVTGISDPYEPPLHPGATIRGASETHVEGAARILARLEELGWVPAAPAPGPDPDEAVVRAQLRALQNR